MIARINDDISVANIAHQTPFNSKKIGKTSINPIWNTRERKKASTADTVPLFNAVKKPDEYIVIPDKINAKEHIRIALIVNA